MMKKSKTTILRVSALLLIVATLLSVLPAGVYAIDTQDHSPDADTPKIMVLHNGAEEKSVTLDEKGCETLTAFVSETSSDRFSWQILIPDTEQWVNISGRTQSTLNVTLALVGSMLNSNNMAYIRCTLTDGDKVYNSKPVEIVVSYEIDGKESAETLRPVMLSAPKLMAASAETDGDETATELVTIVINYIFDNGGMAFEPYGASIAKGSDFSADIKSPAVVGYEPFIRKDGEYVDASTVSLNYTNVETNIVVNVIYEPALVKFQVHHHLQDIYDDIYSTEADYITESMALTGSVTPTTGLALELNGFRALSYESLSVAADGSTVVEIRYDRNYYLVNFDMSGGFGTEPVYTRFGAKVGANAPTRHGYVFDGWKLTRFGTAQPTAAQESQYDMNNGTIIVPDANLTYTAIWITQSTTYSMVFWMENINDDGYTYWGHLENIPAMSGTTVSGSDRVGEVADIVDSEFFTYCDALTDKNVIVEGDGSTIVNVYYTRNRYTITFRAKGRCVIPVGHTHGDDCYECICSKSHVHTDECNPQLTCTKPEHTAHTDECIICGIEAHEHDSSCCGYSEHVHELSCWNNYYIGNPVTKPNNAPSNPVDGQIYRRNSSNVFIYIKGTWYKYNSRWTANGSIIDVDCGYTEHIHGSSDCNCDKTVHIHSDSCYSDTLHTHDEDDCYTYSCAKDPHVHTSGCFLLNCGIPQGHTHSSTCNSASSTNTVKLVYKKYQQDLGSIWPITDDNGKTYDQGERWKPSNSTDFSQVLVYIANMPGDDFTLTLDESSYDTFTMNYYLEVLPKDRESGNYDVEYNGKYYELHNTIKANYNYLTEAEDFFEINGYYRIGSTPSFSGGQLDINGGGTVNMYYGRNVTQSLKFQSNGIVLNDKEQTGIMYGESISQYNFVPDYPANLEPNAFVFGGWYTSPGHYDGTEVDWDTATMAAGDVLYYAKWAPIVHKLNVYLTSELTEQIGTTQEVGHGAFAVAPTETVSNGNYIFQGWFYVDDDGEEKAFIFSGIPVLDDMDIYAKWSSHVSVKYTINYVYKKTDGTIVTIADPTIGSAIAGHNKTFPAKAGDELYEGYRTGYYPLANSHTVTMSAERDHEYTFEYVYVESMPYLVKYVDTNGNVVAESKKILDNNLSVVTETFVRVDGMMPDAYQKRLVLSASGSDSDNDGILDNNVITFNYSVNTTQTYCHIVHYIQEIHGSSYREYRSEDIVGDIGSTLTFSSITLTGFAFNGAQTRVNGEAFPVTGTSASVKLNSDGLLVEFYYDRVNVSYVVNYLEYGTNNVLHAQKTGTGIFGGQIVEQAPGLTHLGYKLVSDSVQMLHLSTNATTNVITFYYQEITYSIQYVIVGAAGCGTLSQSSENIYAVTDEFPIGSKPIANAGYHFVGWYLDEACTQPVDPSWIEGDDHIVPKRDGDVWHSSHTFYAKIDPDYTDLTISVQGVDAIDDGQVIIYRIQGATAETQAVDVTVAIKGNGSVTVSELRLGKYTVTELSDWSFRYQPDGVSKEITLSVDKTGNKLVFSHARVTTGWLDGNNDLINDFSNN